METKVWLSSQIWGTLPGCRCNRHQSPSAGLVHVARLKDLETLYLGSSRITGSGLARLDLPKPALRRQMLPIKDFD